MSYAPRRAALLSLCVLAILLAASLFPATGFGTVPDVPAPNVGGTDGGAPDDGPVTSTDPGPTARTTDGIDDATTTRSTTDGTTTTAANTTTTSTRTTTTDTGGVGGPSGDGGSLGTALAAGVLAVTVGALAVALRAMGYRRRGWWLEADGDLPDLPPPRVRAGLQSIPRTTMGLVMGLSASIPGLLDSVGASVAGVLDGASAVFGEFARVSGRLAVGVPAAFARGLGAAAGGFGSALAGFPSVFASLGSGLGTRDWSLFDRGSRGRSGKRPRTDPREAGESEPAPPRTVEEAWDRMTDLVHVRNARAATPGEYARAAVRRGYPEGAVERLTRLFEEVRYGGLPADERTEAALDAIARIRRSADGGDET